MKTEPLTAQELAAGVAANNTRALEMSAWRLRWMFRQVVPTGTFFPVKFEVPESAAFYRLEYLFIAWPVTGAFRPIFVDIGDDRGQKFTLVETKKAETRLGMKVSLFTTPNVDPNSALAGDQSQQLGAMPLDLDFPGRAEITINVRGALATPNPATINFLLHGHLKNKVG